MPALWASFSEITMLLSATFIALGWIQIRRHHVHTHRLLMLIGSALGALFFISYAADSLFVGDTEFGGTGRIVTWYDIFLNIHVMLATLAAVLGVVTIRLAVKGKFRKHRQIAPWTAVFWFITTATGLAVFLLLFVIYPEGPTVKNLLHVLFQ